MAIALEELILQFSIDSDGLEKGLDSVSARARAKAKEIEGMAIAPKVDLKGLHDLNKLLDVKQRHIKETADFAKRNPVVVGVDFSDVTDAIKELKELREETKKSGNKSSGSKSSRGSSNETGTLFQEMEEKLTGKIKEVVNKVGGIATAPFAGIGRGFFEGFGQSISKELSKGLLGSLDKELNVNLKNAGSKAANATVDYFFPQMPDKRKYEAKAQEYKQNIKDIDSVISELEKNVRQATGLSNEKESLKALKNKSNEVKKNLKENSTFVAEKGIPSKKDVLSYGEVVTKQINDIEYISRELGEVSHEITQKLKLYKKLETSIPKLRDDLDLAANTGDYDLLQKTKKKIGKHVASIKDLSGDSVIDNHRNELLSMGKNAKIDEKLIVKTSEKQTLKDFISNPKQAIALTAKKQALKIQESAEEIKGDLIHFAIEGAKATVRNVIGGGKGLYKLAEAGEKMTFALAPFGEAQKAKNIAQGAAKIAIPAVAFGSLANVPGGHQISEMIVTLVRHAIETGVNPLESSILGEITQIVRSVTGALPNALGHPLANQIIGELQSIIHTVSGFLTGGGAELGGAVLGGQGLRALGEQGAKKVGQSVTTAIAPSENPSKYLEGTKKAVQTQMTQFGEDYRQARKLIGEGTGYNKRLGENIGSVVHLLPESQRGIALKAAPLLANAEKLYSGELDYQKEYNIPGLKGFNKKQFEKSSTLVQKIVKEQIIGLFNQIERMKAEIDAEISGLVGNEKKGILNDLATGLGSKLSALQEKGKQFGIGEEKLRIEKTSKLPSINVDAVAIKDLSKIEKASQKVGKEVAANWDKTEKDVSQSMIEITKTAQEQSYPLKKAMSEGSPGPTFWIRENWKKTADFVKSQIKSIAEPANQLFNSGQKNAGKINIPNKTGIDPDLLKRQQWSKPVTVPNTSPTNPRGIVSPPLPVMSPDEIKKTFGGNTGKTLTEIPNKIREKADTELGKGTVEYYDNFLGNIKKTLASRLGGGGSHGDHLADQIMTFLFAGASTISPQIGPMLAAAPLFMPLIPAAIASVGIANLIAPAIGKIDQAIRQQQPLDQRFQTLTGSKELGQAKRNEIVGLSEKYTTSAEKGTENFTQMAIAARGTNLTDGEMKGLYEGISASIRALNLDTQDAGLIFMAYTQMLAKGKISMEELRQQLGERFPPAMSVFAKALGTSTAGLEDLISRGAVSTDQWVPKVTKVLKEDFGGAALAMGDSYTSAMTKIENTNFALNKNFSDTYGGIFATVTNAWSGVLATVNKNFKILNALAISGLIAVGASIAIGLTYILKMPAINNFMVGGTSILLSTFKFSLKALTPFLIGTLADVMDDVFGTKNNVFDNMSKGVGNFVTGVFVGIDKSIRNTTGVSLFDPFKIKSDPFAPYSEGIDKLKKQLGGFVELTALVLMFEQVRVLGTMFILPLFKNMASATVGWGKAIKEALLNKDTGIKTIGDLFGGTLIGLTGVNRSKVIEKNKAEFDALRQEQRALAQNNPLANFGRAKEALIQGDLNSLGHIGVTRKDVLSARAKEIDDLAKTHGLSLNAQGKYLPSVDNDPLVQYHKKRDELLKTRMNQAARSRALMFAGSIALEAGLALGIMSFAKGDFSNNLGGELNKAKTKMVAAIDGIKSALDGLKGTAKEVGAALSGIKLPSKGAQLDIRNILGDNSKDFKWDDLITSINKQGLGAAKARQAITSTLQFLTGSQKGTIGAGIAEYIGIPNVGNIEKNINDAQKIGLKDYYVQDKNLLPTMAQDQLLNFGKDLEKLQSDIKSKLKNNAFDINDLSKPLSSEYKTLIKEVNDIDKKLQGMGSKRLSLATINTTQSRKEIAALDIEINALLKERKDKVVPFGKIEDNVKDWKSSLKTISDTIKNDPSIPLAAKTALNNLLKPSIDYVDSVSNYLKGQGIGKLAQPLMDVWDSVINKLRDVDLALQKLRTKNEKSFAEAQIKIYKSSLGTVALSPALQKESLKDLQNQEALLQQTIDKKQALLNQVLAVANVGDTNEKRSKIEEIKKEILDASKDLDNTRVSIARASYEIKNNFAIEDSARAFTRSLVDLNVDIKRQQMDYTQQIETYRREVQDAGISAQRENRDLVESFSDLMLDLETQIKNANNELLDTQAKIKNTKFKTSLLSVSPGIDSYGQQIGNLFASYFDTLAGSESESRKLETQQEQVQREYVNTLRRIRAEQEKQFDAEKNRTRAIADLAIKTVQLAMNLEAIVRGLAQRTFDFNLKNERENKGMPGYQATPVQAPNLPNPNLQAIYQQQRAINPQVIQQTKAQNNVVPTQPTIYKPLTVQEQFDRQVPNLQSAYPIQQIQSIPVNTPMNVNVMASSKDMDLFARLVLAEAKGEGIEGMAGVARAVLNRQTMIRGGLPASNYMAKSGSLIDIITAKDKKGRFQFSPLGDGSINNKFTQQQLDQARQAIAIASDTNAFKSMMRGTGMGESQVSRMTNATGFRNTGTAAYDASQDHNTVKFRRHTFNGDRLSKNRLQAFNFGIPEGLNNEVIVAGNFVGDMFKGAGKAIQSTFNKVINTIQSDRKKWNLTNWIKEYGSKLSPTAVFDLGMLENWLKKEAKRTGNVDPAVLKELRTLVIKSEKDQKESNRIYSEMKAVSNGKMRENKPSNNPTPKVNPQPINPARLTRSAVPAVVPLDVLNEQLKNVEQEKYLTSNVTGKILTLRKKQAEDWLFMVAQIKGIDKRFITDAAVDAVNTGKLGKTFKFTGVDLHQKDFESYVKMSPEVKESYIKMYQSGKLREKYLAEQKTATAKPPSTTKTSSTKPQPKQQNIAQQTTNQVQQQIAPFIPNNAFNSVYPPSIQSDFSPAYSRAEGAYSAQSASIDAQKELNVEQSKYEKAKFDFEQSKLKFSFASAMRQTDRSIRDSGFATDELISQAKGYLTVTENIAKAAKDVSNQYQSQIDAYSEQSKTIENNYTGLDKIIELTQDRIDNDKTITEMEREQLRTNLFDLNLQLEGLPLQQQKIEAKKLELEKTRQLAEATAAIRKQEEERLSTLKAYADLQGNLASARYNQGGTLVNESPIIKARMDAIVSMRDAKKLLETGAVGSDYVAMTKELADINISQSYVDAIPFLKEFSSDLKAAVLETNNFTEAFSKLFKLAASKVFDQFVLKPFQNTVARYAKELGLIGGDAKQFNTPQVASGLIQNNIVPTNQFNLDNINQTQVATDSLKSFTQTLNTVPTATDSIVKSFTDGSITQEFAIASFTQGLIQATLALQSFAIAAGGSVGSGLLGSLLGGSTSSSLGMGAAGIFGNLFSGANAAAGSSIGSALSGGFTGIMQGVLPFFAEGGTVTGNSKFYPQGTIPTKPGGFIAQFLMSGAFDGAIENSPLPAHREMVARAKAKELASSGKTPQLAMLHEGEEILSTKKNEAGIYQMLKKIFGKDPLNKLERKLKALEKLPNFAEGTENFMPNGIESALTKERAMSGKKPYLAALHEGEAVLSTLNGDSALYRNLRRSGQWDELKTGDQIPNFARGTDGGTSQSNRTQSSSGNRSGGGTYTVNLNQTIVTPNANSFNSSERQRNQDLMVQLNKTVR